jgi:hypothetical protein
MSVVDVPLIRHDPIEHLGAAGDLSALERDVLREHLERLAHTIAGEAAADGEEAMHQLQGLHAQGVLVPRVGDVQHHATIALRQ